MQKLKTPIKAIRAKCMECSCDQVREIRECPRTKCPLYPYRMGRRPSEVELVDLGLSSGK